MQLDEGMALIRRRRGLIRLIADTLGLTPAAVAHWRRVPAERLPIVEEISGIPRWLLRGDICQPPEIPPPIRQPLKARRTREPA